MNANELIEHNKNKLFYINQMIESHEKLDKQFGGHQELITEYRCKKEEVESVIRELSRTRIRVTAEEKPTDTDCDKFGRVLAYDCTSMTWELLWFEVVKDEDEGVLHYTLWTQLPEVTP